MKRRPGKDPKTTRRNLDFHMCGKEELKDVFRFFRELGADNVLRLEPSREKILWKYGSGKSKAKHISLAVIKHGKKVTGCCGLLYRKLFGVYNGERCVWPSETMITHKDDKQPFIFYKFYLAIKRIVKPTMALYFQNSKKLHDSQAKVSGAHSIPGYVFYRRIRSGDHVLSLPGIDIADCMAFDGDFDTFFKKIIRQYDFICNRDTGFLKWRYMENPGKKYRVFRARKNGKMKGYIITGTDEAGKSGLIVDILTDKNEPGCLYGLVLRALEHFRNRGIQNAQCLLTDKYYIKKFLKMNFIPREKQYTMATFMKKELEKKYLASGRCFHITMGDGDYRGCI